ncbi:uncharacterized protein LOC111356134 [Spodoptera litura]|uniref:Uncharacterized protein LOC111356134 n=2 Tax=Spodoptera TaxID=7106 RepID=A0A9J7ECG7_SPOLT|nr:uncharacterized protein LOC111356134 [Spodoptera litura]
MLGLMVVFVPKYRCVKCDGEVSFCSRYYVVPDLVSCLRFVPAQFIPGRTGAGLLILNGFTFYMKNHQAHGKKQWYCSSRDVHGCRADVITYKGIYYLPSHRTGSMVLIYNDNKYWINNRYQNTINWTCRDRKRLGCNSCVQTTIEGRYLKHKGFHNHEDNYTKYNFND